MKYDQHFSQEYHNYNRSKNKRSGSKIRHVMGHRHVSILKVSEMRCISRIRRDNFLFRMNNDSFINSVFMSITMNVDILFVDKEMTMTRSWIIVVSNLKIVRRVFTCIFVSELIDAESKSFVQVFQNRKNYIFQYIRWFWCWSRKNEYRESVWRNIYPWISQLFKHVFQNQRNSHI